MIKDNRNNEQIYGRNDMIMLDPNNKIYGSLGIADRYVMKTEEGTRLILSKPKLGKFGDVLTEFNIYGRSEQKQYKGINLLPPDTNINEYVEVSIPKGSLVFWVTDGTPSNGGNFRFFNEDKTESMWFGVDSGTTSARVILKIDAKYVQNLIVKDFDLSKICLGVGNKPIYEPYVGGKPSPNPEYPQEIKSVGDSGSVAVKVTGKNILDMKKSRESITNSGVTYARNADYSFTRTGTATNSIGNVWMAGGYMVEPNADLSNVFCVLLKGVTYSIKDCVLIACSPDGKVLVARNENFVPTQDMYITGVCNENFIINKTYNDIVYPAVYVGAKALQYEPYREQLLALPYTLNAIPVSSGGNYTDQSGQQWICDEVDLHRGVKVQRIKVKELSPDDKWAYRKLASGNNNFQCRIFNADIATDGKPCFCNILPFKNVIWDDSIQNLPKIYANKQEIIVSFPPSSEYSSLEAFKQLLTNVKSVIYYILDTHIETDLTPEEIEQYKKLSTKTPTTIVENNYNTWMKATYKSTESV